jgi:luciferase family oxidoreductase group 1
VEVGQRAQSWEAEEVDDSDLETRNPHLPVLPLSVLDLATVSEGATSAAAVADTTRLARRADELGYLRFWVAEHHNMATVASTTPPVLIAHLAAATERIKVGSGGVMLPNHPPLVVAEQFALLEAMHPGRIDLGIGRAPGTDRVTAAALRRSPDGLGAEDFPRHLIDVMGLLGDVRTEEGLWQRFAATPVATSSPEILLLGSSDFSAELAGILGLPFAFAHHFDMGGTLEAVDIYRRSFQPSPVLDHPYTIVSATVLAAESTERATWLAGPSLLRRYGMRTGRLLPLVSPEDAAAHPDIDTARAMSTGGIFGTPAEVVAGLDALAAATGANELMTFMPTYAIGERMDSLEAVAGTWGLQPREAKVT